MSAALCQRTHAETAFFCLELRSKSTETAADPLKRRVFLVDDDSRFCAILGQILEQRGYEVTSCHDGDKALSLIRSGAGDPDLIICDIHMPRTDGVVFLKQLRQMGKYIPLLMVTSDEDVALEAELVELGADAYVRKQEDLKVLLAWCRNLSRKAQGAQAYAVAA